MVKCEVLDAQSCPALCDPMGSQSSVHGILQTRILEWVAIPFSRGPFQHRDGNVSPASQAAFQLLVWMSH